jgi:hypothetical protein
MGDEPYVMLLINPAAGDGMVHTLYEPRGYKGNEDSISWKDFPVDCLNSAVAQCAWSAGRGCSGTW